MQMLTLPLKLGHENIDTLEKVFGFFYESGLSLGLFTRHHEHIHHSRELQIILGNCYTDLLRLVTGINLYYSRKQLSMLYCIACGLLADLASDATYGAHAFVQVFGQRIDLFLAYSDQFTATIWKKRLESLSQSVGKRHGNLMSTYCMLTHPRCFLRAGTRIFDATRPDDTTVDHKTEGSK